MAKNIHSLKVSAIGVNGTAATVAGAVFAKLRKPLSNQKKEIGFHRRKLQQLAVVYAKLMTRETWFTVIFTFIYD